MWEAELLDSLILINVVPGISVVVRKVGPFLVNVVAEITGLWVEKSQKINCRDVTSIREGRVLRDVSGQTLINLRTCLHSKFKSYKQGLISESQ